MSEPVPSVPAAQERAESAKARLADTASRLKARLAPRELARDAMESIADTSERTVKAGVDAARRRPVVAAAAGGAAVLLLLRHRIAALFHRKPRKVPAQPIDHSRDHPPQAKGTKK